MTACFTCKTREAVGNSAYCERDQPVSQDPPLKGFSQCLCAVCSNVFATLKNFDGHRQTVGGETTCLDPRGMGLELREGVWGTPEGNALRDRKAAQISKFPGNAGGRAPGRRSDRG